MGRGNTRGEEGPGGEGIGVGQACARSPSLALIFVVRRGNVFFFKYSAVRKYNDKHISSRIHLLSSVVDKEL